MEQDAGEPAGLLEMRKICKQFPGVTALKNVDFSLHKGDVHVLMGTNGAGKSTLMKVLSGVYRKDSGEIYIDSQPVEIENSRHSQNLGVAIIHQHFSQAHHLSVAENIFLGREPTRFGIIGYRKMYAAAQEALALVGLEVDVREKAGNLSVSQRQMVEIAKALSFNSKILIMDEPTSALTRNETETLFTIIQSLKQKGIGIVYISHRIEELRDIGTRVTVMRDGEVVGVRPIAGTEMSSLVKMMIGKDVKYNIRRSEDAEDTPLKGAEALRVENLNSPGKLFNINFSLREGEILGLFGLMGAGRTELARAVFGVDKFAEGGVFLFGKKAEIKSPALAVKNGLGFLTEDRLISGLAMQLSVAHNVTLPALSEFLRCGLYLDVKKEKQRVGKLVCELNIRTPGQAQPVQFLSGGNQQKVVFAKWIMAQSRILILDDPTQGIDVGAKEEVHKFIYDFTRKEKKSVILISSELPEIISLCDRVLVIRDGRLVADIPSRGMSQEAVMSAAVGSDS
ncbi:MAG: sugar ABC transporter ATP-binding protein [Spirochaetales bacterium]|jgi:ribose transport system ATP-binding protein|nr:sugar ABC transporter ATP-binding protein [Spirochaetales bacterium]